jgi:hypothetical protein
MSYNIIKFPTQLSKIKDASAFRNYCLNPKGLQVIFYWKLDSSYI